MSMNLQEARHIAQGVKYWHYPFNLPWGPVKPTRASEGRHQLRRAHLFGPLLERYGGSLRGKTVLDLGCCQGFWAFEAAREGAASYLGIDSSTDFVREAEALSVILDVRNCEFRLSHVENDTFWKNLLPRDITLFLGLFYHLADPIFVLRKAMDSTLDTLVIDTNVTDDKKATLTIVSRDLSEPTTCNSNLATAIRVVPSLAALHNLLADGGFKDIRVIKPQSAMPREYHNGQRASIIAFR